ncbi:MAG TPA: serine/threonine-protein kinase, partial [Gemmatimonadales bacterium]|nr:serine/threonine-protein kinase [Gemmatimonadales bacterium]
MALESALAERYRIERELGRGGMATVYLAHDLRHDRPVALKLLHPELAHSLGPERFLREIKMAARLQHPHILTVLDSGEAAGQLWFTMPFVDGESLRDRLDRERQLAVEESVRIATEVGRALDHAHRHGIIHRDIKPENILLTIEGDTLVADFGIARALGGGEQQLTETGMAVGTPAYMSPEQATGERDLDARTDVYALGSVLYEMLAGEAPFTGPTAQAVIAKRMRGEVPQVRTVRPNVPPLVEAAISRALAPVPADRWASAGDFTRVLSSASSMHAASTTVPRAVPRRIPAGLALLLIGFLVGAGVLFAWRKGSASPAPRTRAIAVLPFDNQGDSTQDYFADGITDEVRGKLTVLPGVVVIASNSSRAYRNSDKPLEQVAGELGADYLLMAKVRWARSSDGSIQVRVSPELVAVTGGKPTTRWQQGFDA